MADVASRLAKRVQLTTDGHRPYLLAVDAAFGGEIDYAMLVKIYGYATAGSAEAHYSPAECTGARKDRISGDPDLAHVSTSFAEWAKLTTRMRRSTRLTNALSKKLESHEHAVALSAMHHNYVRRHQTHRLTPAMKVGLANKLWSIEDMIALLD